MAITLNLQHTFTTRVVYSTEELQEIRKGLTEAAVEGRALLLSLKGKRKADCLVGIRLSEKAVSLDDEAMMLFLTKQAMKDWIAGELRRELKDLNVTRMSPLKTEVVG
ncbi:hypothetical protein [Pseudomonas rubra]|uniref:Antitoxin n=1 Tax=Pseudomonas rubra TaxID=2942627 RepID=A0ABT5P6E3_9PSED|nr:hypothetical protein [Pseudomonas rubra]MDD1013860.1 hypothetical protein [Pseudomonas rubra]MDD1038319.1 hypothetical protein [Pseudomonas rubra]MDD1154591.1 hypothetical protein [Pseudomonas rubra]